MKVDNISKKTIEFFKNNGKRIICSSIAAGIISLPLSEVIAEQHDENEFTSQMNRPKSEQSIDYEAPKSTDPVSIPTKDGGIATFTLDTKRDERYDDYAPDPVVIDEDKLENGPRITIEDPIIYYGKWDKQADYYVREVFELKIKEEKMNSLLQMLMENPTLNVYELLNNTGGEQILEIVGKKKEESKDVPIDYGKNHVEIGSMSFMYDDIKDEIVIGESSDIVVKYYSKWEKNDENSNEYHRRVYRLKPTNETIVNDMKDESLSGFLAWVKYSNLVTSLSNSQYLNENFEIIESYEEAYSEASTNINDLQQTYMEIEGTNTFVSVQNLDSTSVCLLIGSFATLIGSLAASLGSIINNKKWTSIRLGRHR